jgi:tripartite-type tricarboxylate transporter receptor subunit TctC
VTWLGMLAPVGVPDAIAKKLEAELMKAARLPDVAKRVQDSASVLVGGSARDFADFIARETPLWEMIIRKNNIKGVN